MNNIDANNYSQNVLVV